MTRNEQRLVLIFVTVAAAGLLFLFFNRYRFYYNYVKIALYEGEKSAVTASKKPADTGKRGHAPRTGSDSRLVGGNQGGVAGDNKAGGAAGGKTAGKGGKKSAGDGNAGVMDLTGKIDINHAGLNELMSLPGIGRVTALNIIEYRTKKGGFTNVRELIEVQGIGQKKLDAVLEYVVAE